MYNRDTVTKQTWRRTGTFDEWSLSAASLKIRFAFSFILELLKPVMLCTASSTSFGAGPSRMTRCTPREITITADVHEWPRRAFKAKPRHTNDNSVSREAQGNDARQLGQPTAATGHDRKDTRLPVVRSGIGYVPFTCWAS